VSRPPVLFVTVKSSGDCNDIVRGLGLKSLFYFLERPVDSSLRGENNLPHLNCKGIGRAVSVMEVEVEDEGSFDFSSLISFLMAIATLLK
jgi:hypothetical protein